MSTGLKCVIAWAGLGLGLAAAAPFTFGPHPRLTAGAPEARSQTAEDARIVSRARDWLAKGLEVPSESGDWIFYYSCPAHNVALVLKGRQHTCPVCGAVSTDARTRRAWVTQRHNAIDGACVDMAQAWRISGDEAFAREVWRILCRLAELAPGWDRHDRWGRRGLLAVIGGKRYAQSLDDAYGVILLARAYDLVYDWPGISAAERLTVERDLFRDTADSIHRMYALYDGKNNHMTWFNAAVATVDAVLGEVPYLERALSGGKGLRWQLATSVTAEGLWYEGALAYHFYALDAVMITLAAARSAGADVASELETTRRMLLAPLALAYPNGILPAINDSDRASLAGYRHAYLRAATLFDDVAICDFASGGSLQQRPSEVLADAGLAYLRQWGDNPVTAILDFGQHGGHHGHPDKLNLLLFAAGKELFPDIGRLTYRCPEYETWTRQTVAHNTVVLGRRSQQEDDGRVLSSGRLGDADYVVGESRNAYDGTLLRRALVLLPGGALVDLFRVEQRGRGVTAEWVLHGTAPLVLADVDPLQAVKSPLHASEGYQHLEQIAQVEVAETVKIVWQVSADRTYMTWLLNEGGAKETLVTATGIGFTLSERLPLVIRSRTAAPLTVFAAVHAPFAAAAEAWQVTSDDKRTVITGRPGGQPVRITWDGAAGVTMHLHASPQILL